MAVVDAEFAICRQQDGGVRVPLYKGRRGFTNQRGEDPRPSVRADAVAPGQKQALAFDLNVPVRLNVGPQIGGHPELARRGSSRARLRSRLTSPPPRGPDVGLQSPS